jgi:hypothetical protein
MKRDLEADLKTCEAATEGRWSFNGYSLVASVPRMREAEAAMDGLPEDAPDEAYSGIREHAVCKVPCVAGDTSTDQGRKDAEMIAASREGWPAAIRRAIAAEGLLRRLVATYYDDESTEQFTEDAIDIAVIASELLEGKP